MCTQACLLQNIKSLTQYTRINMSWNYRQWSVYYCKREKNTIDFAWLLIFVDVKEVNIFREICFSTFNAETIVIFHWCLRFIMRKLKCHLFINVKYIGILRNNKNLQIFQTAERYLKYYRIMFMSPLPF